jgi:transposase
VLRSRWRNIVVNVHEPSEEKSDESKDSFYEELEQVFDHFPKYHMKMLLKDFNAKLGRDNFSSQQLDRRVSIRIVMIMGLD